MEADEEAEETKRRGMRRTGKETKDVGKNRKPNNPRFSQRKDEAAILMG
jgi:hypothetical protein